MRKVFSFCLLAMLFVLSLLIFRSNVHKQKGLNQRRIVSITPTTVINKSLRFHTSLFVPYWSLDNTKIPDTNYDTVIYFGIAPNADGIDIEDDGYKNLTNFLERAQGIKDRILTVRAINQEVNDEILRNKDLQQKIFEQATGLAIKYNFSGLLLDFEFSSLNFDTVKNEITGFINGFSNAAHVQGLTFYEAVYGDVFYRDRPFDVLNIAKKVDGIYVMAYDFHKANGDPGPNFPFIPDDVDNYDFQTMTKDFLKNVPPEKLFITFGLFGYDWTVGDSGQSVKQAIPLSLNQIKQKFINNCSFKNCKISTNKISQETNVSYIDQDGSDHIVWFEDLNSIDFKKKFLFPKGINHTAMWAYSYF